MRGVENWNRRYGGGGFRKLQQEVWGAVEKYNRGYEVWSNTQVLPSVTERQDQSAVSYELANKIVWIMYWRRSVPGIGTAETFLLHVVLEMALESGARPERVPAPLTVQGDGRRAQGGRTHRVGRLSEIMPNLKQNHTTVIFNNKLVK